MEDAADAAHMHDDVLELYARGRLECAQLTTVDSHLLGCERCRERLGQRVALIGHYHPGHTKEDSKQRRSEKRFVTGDDAVIQALNPLSMKRHVVRILDISKHGVGIRIVEPLLPGTIVQIRTGSAVEIGEVRNCMSLSKGGYRAGMYVADDG